MALPQFQDGPNSFQLMQNAWATLLNPLLNTTAPLPLTVGTAVKVNGTLVGTNYTNFSNAPSVTIRPGKSTKIKVYGTMPIANSTSAGAYLRINVSAGSPTIVFSQEVYFESSNVTTVSPYLIVSVAPNTTYTFTVQGQSSSGATTLTLYNSLPTNGTVLIAEEV